MCINILNKVRKLPHEFLLYGSHESWHLWDKEGYVFRLATLVQLPVEFTFIVAV